MRGHGLSYHSSPFYNWEKIVTIAARYANRFTPSIEPAAVQAAELMLLCQQPSGAFASASTGGAENREETALALFALKYAQLSASFKHQHARIQHAVAKAYAWLERQPPVGEGGFVPSLWVEKIQNVAPSPSTQSYSLGFAHR
jgi:hypothetical protein